jgi:hypothetical protein
VIGLLSKRPGAAQIIESLLVGRLRSLFLTALITGLYPTLTAYEKVLLNMKIAVGRCCSTKTRHLLASASGLFGGHGQGLVGWHSE